MNIYLIGFIILGILILFIGIPTFFHCCCNCNDNNNSKYTEL